MERDAILVYLESHFQRILKASVTMNEFVKAARRNKRLPNKDAYDLYSDKVTHVGLRMLLLERYAQSFWSNAPDNILNKIRAYGDRFDSHHAAEYNPEALTEYFPKLQKGFKDNDASLWYELFRLSVDRLDAAFIKILRARREVFKHDTFKEYGCEIHFDIFNFEMLTEMVNWESAEPRMYPGKAERNRDDDSEDE